MNKKLLAGLATVGILTGGGSVTALAVGGAPEAAASTATVASRTSKAPECGPLEPLVAKGTITHAQAIAIYSALIGYVRAHWRNALDTVLGQQVNKHTITRSQANAVIGAITQWVHKHESEEPSHHGPCHYGPHPHMTGGSGSP